MEGEAPHEPIQVNIQKVKPPISQIPADGPGCSDIRVYLRRLRLNGLRFGDSGRNRRSRRFPQIVRGVRISASIRVICVIRG